MKTFSKFLVEADTSGATYVEMAICVAYNQIKGHKDPMDAAGISSDNWAKVSTPLREIGLKVAGSLKGAGNVLIHSGSGASKTYYKRGSDTTPKTDLYGNKNSRFSLKQAGDSGTGAQLMSAKSGEASGVLNFAVQHLENVQPDVTVKGTKKAFDILRNKMLSTAKNDLNVEVGKGKNDFEKWYLTSSPRLKEVQKYILSRGPKGKGGVGKPKDVEKHLKAELSLLGATRMSSSASKNLAKGLESISRDKLLKMLKTYISSGMKIGDVTVSDKYLEKISKKDLSKTNLRKQIAEVIKVSIDSTEWQDTLTSFFENNSELKKWIVYEAASGLGKFTGKSSDGSNYSGSTTAVANSILVFDKNGIKKKENIYDWSMSNSSLASNISVSYKGSGRSKYIKLGISAGKEYDNVSMINESIIFDDIVDLQYVHMQYEMDQLFMNEGMFDWAKEKFASAKSAAQNLYSKLQDIVKNFYENVIKKFFEKITEWISKGITYALDILGIEMDGDVALDTPSW
tara:strand:+ start:193 stop:1731 length:1539 start_codon:yes stop_codon:yes gene_type:complete